MADRSTPIITHKRTWHFYTLLLALLLLGSLLVPATTFAATITVTSSVQEYPFLLNGNCTLGEAIQAANLDTAVDGCPTGAGTDTIKLAADTIYEMTVVAGVFQQATPTITSAIIIQGNNAIIKRISSEDNLRLFGVGTNGSLTLESLTLSNGSAYDGGAIFNKGQLYLDTVVIRDSQAGVGGGIHNVGSMYLDHTTIENNGATYGGGIYNERIMHIANSTIKQNALISNYTYGLGGGIFNRGSAFIDTTILSEHTSFGIYGADGGVITSFGSITISNSIIRDNQAARSTIEMTGTMYLLNSTIRNNQAIRVASINNNGGNLTIVGSTIDHNVAENGITGGIVNSNSLTIVNSTISSNKGKIAGAIFNGDYVSENYNSIGRMTLSHTTIVDNEVTPGFNGAHAGGIVNSGTIAISMTHTILGDNILSDGSPSDCAGSVLSQGYNLVETTVGCDFTSSAGDQIGVEPQMGPLADNGGATLTHLLLPDSPAINAGDSLYNGALVTDQRGSGFARIIGGRIDIGAIEFGTQPPTTTMTSTTTSTMTSTMTSTVTATDPTQTTTSLPPTNTATSLANTPTVILTNTPTATLTNTPTATQTVLPRVHICQSPCILLPSLRR